MAPDGGETREPETTASLLGRVRAGEPAARERLLRRYLPILKAWARGRLPAAARHLAETDDLVQVTLLRALDAVQGFEYRGEGSFLAYLRTILKNEIADQLRSAVRRPAGEPMPESLTMTAPSPLEAAIGQQTLDLYEAALARLSAAQQEAVVLRIELGFSWPEVAEATGSPTANAARMTVARALARLAEEMDAGR